MSKYTDDAMDVLDQLLVLRREKLRLWDQGGQFERIQEIDKAMAALRKKIM